MKVLTQLRTTLVQTDLSWLDPVANRQMLEEKFLALQGKTDLIVLPEIYNRA
jgi:omega-amidase